nr:hypothetical protein [Tanacetum cinerariifolium]
MANLSEDIQCAGSDTRPPMLDRTDFVSWQQRIRIYCRGKENRVNILKSIDEGPYQIGTIRETLAESTEGAPQFGPERPRVYSHLSPEEKYQYNADIRATNILLQGLLKDIYTLIKHYTDAKDIWDNVKMLLEGSELTKEDRESQLNIKMTMSRIQLNSKFMNNMLPEWGRFVTAVKLNRGLRDSNYDQLYAYLKQHETHAKENKMMLEQFSQNTVDPLALMSNVSNTQRYSPSSSTSSSTQVSLPLADNPHLNSSLSPAENLIDNLTNTLALLTQSYKTFLPQTNNQLRTSSNARSQATIQDGRVVVQNVYGRQNRGHRMNPHGGGAAGYEGAQNRVGNVNQGQARPVKCYNCNGTRHITRNCTQPKRPQNSEYYKDKMLLMQAQENGVALDVEQLLFLTDGQDNAFDDDVDEQPALTAQTMFMANMSSADHVIDEAGPSYDSDILSEPALYNGHEIIKDNHAPAIVHNTEDTLEIAEITRKKMNAKMNDPECVTRKVKIAPHDYSKENFLATFTPQKQLTPKQIFWSNDLIKLKSKDLKEQTIVSRPIKALTVYPPNTPATLVPKVLPTKIKDNFEGIQKALTKEMKEMKDVFEELEAEVAQYAVDRKHNAIEWKNLLISNDNLIAECLSKEVFSAATNSELKVARFTKITFAHTAVEARCPELEAVLAMLHNTSHHC